MGANMSDDHTDMTIWGPIYLSGHVRPVCGEPLRRNAWNAILAQQNETYGKAKSAGDQSLSVSFFSLGKRFTALRGKVEWLPEYSFKVVRYTLKYHADYADLNAAVSILASGIWATARRGTFGY